MKIEKGVEITDTSTLLFRHITLVCSCWEIKLEAILLIELLNCTTSLGCLLLTGKERMALGTDFYVDFRLGGSRYKLVTAVAGNLCLIILRLNFFLHDFHLFKKIFI